jgi:hypothetical protein
VNDQMVNSSVVHNNDVVRFGKYTLWVGYESDRRAVSRDEMTAAAAGAAGHTVVLSRAEIGTILEHEKAHEKRQPPPKVVPIAMPVAPPLPKPDRSSTWSSLLFGFVMGTAFGAGIVWWLLNR